MTTDEYLMIGRLESSVKDLQEGQTKLFEKSDEVAGKVDKLIGKIDEGWHTPTVCPLRKDVEDLKSFKARLLGMAAAAGFLFSIVGGWLKDKLFKGG